MLYFYTNFKYKKDDSLNPSSSLKVLWKPLTIDFTWIYCTVIIIALSPLPDPPTTSTFLLRANLGFFGLEFIVNRSVLVNKILLSNLSSKYGSMSFGPPHEAFCQVLFLIY